MLERLFRRDIVRDAAAVVVVTLAIQGLMFYISEPLPLPSVTVVLAVMVGTRVLLHYRWGRASEITSASAHTG